MEKTIKLNNNENDVNVSRDKSLETMKSIMTEVGLSLQQVSPNVITKQLIDDWDALIKHFCTDYNFDILDDPTTLGIHVPSYKKPTIKKTASFWEIREAQRFIFDLQHSKGLLLKKFDILEQADSVIVMYELYQNKTDQIDFKYLLSIESKSPWWWMAKDKGVLLDILIWRCIPELIIKQINNSYTDDRSVVASKIKEHWLSKRPELTGLEDVRVFLSGLTNMVNDSPYQWLTKIGADNQVYSFRGSFPYVTNHLQGYYEELANGMMDMPEFISKLAILLTPFIVELWVRVNIPANVNVDSHAEDGDSLVKEVSLSAFKEISTLEVDYLDQLVLKSSAQDLDGKVLLKDYTKLLDFTNLTGVVREGFRYHYDDVTTALLSDIDTHLFNSTLDDVNSNRLMSYDALDETLHQKVGPLTYEDPPLKATPDQPSYLLKVVPTSVELPTEHINVQIVQHGLTIPFNDLSSNGISDFDIGLISKGLWNLTGIAHDKLRYHVEPPSRIEKILNRSFNALAKCDLDQLDQDIIDDLSYLYSCSNNIHTMQALSHPNYPTYSDVLSKVVVNLQPFGVDVKLPKFFKVKLSTDELNHIQYKEFYTDLDRSAENSRLNYDVFDTYNQIGNRDNQGNYWRLWINGGSKSISMGSGHESGRTIYKEMCYNGECGYLANSEGTILAKQYMNRKNISDIVGKYAESLKTPVTRSVFGLTARPLSKGFCSDSDVSYYDVIPHASTSTAPRVTMDVVKSADLTTTLQGLGVDLSVTGTAGFEYSYQFTTSKSHKYQLSNTDMSAITKVYNKYTESPSPKSANHLLPILRADKADVSTPYVNVTLDMSKVNYSLSYAYGDVDYVDCVPLLNSATALYAPDNNWDVTQYLTHMAVLVKFERIEVKGLYWNAALAFVYSSVKTSPYLRKKLLGLQLPNANQVVSKDIADEFIKLTNTMREPGPWKFGPHANKTGDLNLIENVDSSSFHKAVTPHIKCVTDNIPIKLDGLESLQDMMVLGDKVYLPVRWTHQGIKKDPLSRDFYYSDSLTKYLTDMIKPLIDNNDYLGDVESFMWSFEKVIKYKSRNMSHQSIKELILESLKELFSHLTPISVTETELVDHMNVDAALGMDHLKICGEGFWFVQVHAENVELSLGNWPTILFTSDITGAYRLGHHKREGIIPDMSPIAGAFDFELCDLFKKFVFIEPEHWSLLTVPYGESKILQDQSDVIKELDNFHNQFEFIFLYSLMVHLPDVCSSSLDLNSKSDGDTLGSMTSLQLKNLRIAIENSIHRDISLVGGVPDIIQNEIDSVYDEFKRITSTLVDSYLKDFLEDSDIDIVATKGKPIAFVEWFQNAYKRARELFVDVYDRVNKPLDTILGETITWLYYQALSIASHIIDPVRDYDTSKSGVVLKKRQNYNVDGIDHSVFEGSQSIDFKLIDGDILLPVSTIQGVIFMNGFSLTADVHTINIGGIDYVKASTFFKKYPSNKEYLLRLDNVTTLVGSFEFTYTPYFRWTGNKVSEHNKSTSRFKTASTGNNKVVAISFKTKVVPSVPIDTYGRETKVFQDSASEFNMFQWDHVIPHLLVSHDLDNSRFSREASNGVESTIWSKTRRDYWSSRKESFKTGRLTLSDRAKPLMFDSASKMWKGGMSYSSYGANKTFKVNSSVKDLLSLIPEEERHVFKSYKINDTQWYTFPLQRQEKVTYRSDVTALLNQLKFSNTMFQIATISGLLKGITGKMGSDKWWKRDAYAKDTKSIWGTTTKGLFNQAKFLAVGNTLSFMTQVLSLGAGILNMIVPFSSGSRADVISRDDSWKSHVQTRLDKLTSLAILDWSNAPVFSKIKFSYYKGTDPESRDVITKTALVTACTGITATIGVALGSKIIFNLASMAYYGLGLAANTAVKLVSNVFNIPKDIVNKIAGNLISKDKLDPDWDSDDQGLVHYTNLDHGSEDDLT